MPGNARIVRLGKDMISLDSDIMPIPAPYHFEANELNVMGGKLVYSYCTSWRERTNWPSYDGISEAPSAHSATRTVTTIHTCKNSVMLITFFTTRKDWNNKWPSTEVTVA